MLAVRFDRNFYIYIYNTHNIYIIYYIYTWYTYIIYSCAQVHELPQSHCVDNREGTLFSWLHVYYVHLASVRFEHSACCVVDHLWVMDVYGLPNLYLGFFQKKIERKQCSYSNPFFLLNSKADGWHWVWQSVG